jgi:hypothetical protein
MRELDSVVETIAGSIAEMVAKAGDARFSGALPRANPAPYPRPQGAEEWIEARITLSPFQISAKARTSALPPGWQTAPCSASLTVWA